MHRAERLFQLVLLLRRGRIVTARELAQEVQVSERTIYRDMQSLVLSGIPVEGEAGIGYILREKLDLPPLMFSAEEAKALVLGSRMVQAWGDPSLQQAAQRVLDKVRDIASDPIKNELDDETLFVPGFHVDLEERMTLETVRGAISANRKLSYRYTRRDGTESRRTVRPLGLFCWRSTWTVGAWCELRKSFRNFRLDRIKALEILDSTFEAESGKDLKSYLRESEDRRFSDVTGPLMPRVRG